VTTLISFLGRSQLDSKSGYRTARYRMPDGSEHETAYFGMALAKHLVADEVVLLGTASSMWDLLIEHLAGDRATEEARLALFDAMREGSVTETLLEPLMPAMAERVGRPVTPLVIPSAVAFEDQQQILTRLSESLKEKQKIALDLTHGFRHLAMLGLTAARYLVHARKVCVTGLYYGALDMTQDGITPVIELGGLAHIQEWAEAFEAYDASGDFSRFEKLLRRDGFPEEHAKALVRGWHHVSVSNVVDAAGTLASVHRALGTPLTGASELFRERLRRSLSWTTDLRLSKKFRHLAFEALDRGDVLRASLFGLEAFLARETEARGRDPLVYEERQKTDEQFQQELKNDEHPDSKRQAYWLLKNVRNACAHGTLSTHRKHRQLIKNPDRLREELQAALKCLTNT
jgi:CRISPR-associated Csx2 family protein